MTSAPVDTTAARRQRQTPGSAEAFYRGASEPAKADADPSGPVDFARVRQSADRTGGMQILGPPPFSLLTV